VARPAAEPRFSEKLELDLGDRRARRIAGPKRPQDRIVLSDAKSPVRARRQELRRRRRPAPPRRSRSPRCRRHAGGQTFLESDGAVVIARSPRAPTPPTRGDDGRGPARQERRREGPDRQAVGQDLAGPGLQGRHRLLRGRACGPTSRSSASTSSATAAPPASATPARCPTEVSAAVNDGDLAVTAVLSGNRNFEGRVNPDVKMNYLASPPLVVAYALAGTMDFDFDRAARPGQRRQRRLPQGHLAERRGCRATIAPRSRASCSRRTTPTSSPATSAGSPATPEGDTFAWDDDSTYVRKPPYFEGMTMDDARARPTSPAPACWPSSATR
jgi:aconitate hydratase